MTVRGVLLASRYISNYITKDHAQRFNKKRYWSSRISLPEVRRYWLKASSLDDELLELVHDFSVVWSDPKDVWLDYGRGVLWGYALLLIRLFDHVGRC